MLFAFPRRANPKVCWTTLTSAVWYHKFKAPRATGSDDSLVVSNNAPSYSFNRASSTHSPVIGRMVKHIRCFCSSLLLCVHLF